MIKNKKQMYLVIGAFALVLLLGTTTYAFFNYTRTGASNNIRVGRIYFNSNQTNTINLDNLFPIDPTEQGIMNDSTKVGTFELEITGDTDYSEGIEYLVSSVDSNIYTSTGKIVPISLDVTVTELGTPSANYFTARDNTNESIYKKLVGDTLVGDQMLLVGYIVPNTTTGQADGIDGSITIKAYLDKNKILISDTYDGTESDNMGTTNSKAQGKTVITTGEWNALQNSGVSFKVKVEANEGIWVTGSLEEIMRKTVVMDNVSSDFVSASTGINFGAVSGDTNGKGVYMRAGTENDAYPIMYYRGAVEDNNVIFANKCWKTVRTTDTGGVKLIYNGENTGTIDEPNCNNTGTDTQISLSGTNTFPFSETNLSKSLAYNGYMWGDVYEWTKEATTSGAYYGTGFTWDGTNYTLTSAKVGYDGTHHYTCNLTTAEGTCSSIRYYYYVSGTSSNYYITLTGGDSIEKAIEKMQTNTNESNAKQQIESWFATNMTSYINQLEDTIWCNDRSITTKAGWDPTGNVTASSLYYAGYDRFYNTHTPSLACTNKNDSFTWKNASGNQKLNYPVAMLTVDEMMLAGGTGSTGTFYLNSGSNYYWSLSPSHFYNNGFARGFNVNAGYISYSGNVSLANGLRPAVSLKPGTPVISGTGTVSDPYIIG